MNDFLKKIVAKELRKLRAKRGEGLSFWKAVGTFGVVGWAVSVPIIAGALLGRLIDSRKGGSHSWTLMLLVTGLILGCWNAWFWISKESDDINGNGGAHE